MAQSTQETVTEIVETDETDGVGSIFLDKYIIERVLGEGSYGKVKLATNIENGMKVLTFFYKKKTEIIHLKF